ncbi:MAG: hypothetical protein GY765_31350, partial [bacterium]|nr:hypothetical protein [bacterium]
HASSVTLILKGSATLMATETLTRYAAAQGDGILEWYDEVKQAGPALEKLREHVNGNELLWLDVRVETKSGRKTKQRIRALPPLVSRPLAYTLDISDVPGDVLNIKLTPPASYWMIDYIAVDYGQNEIAHKTTETSVTALSPLKTSGHYSRKTDSENVADLLAKEDNKYLEIPHMGDPVQLIFKAPPLSAGKQRTIILKTGGYYHMKLSAAGMKEQI